VEAQPLLNAITRGEPEGGGAACWLGEVCDSCGRLPDEGLSEDGRCADCRDR
jgi:hypothetical protein